MNKKNYFSQKMISYIYVSLYYRLISEKTIEENILKKANQKKLLGDLAIEGGNFTAAYFKSVSLSFEYFYNFFPCSLFIYNFTAIIFQSTIHDLFNVNFDESDPAKRMNDVISSDSSSSQLVEKSMLTAYESALAAAEDETDVAAARIAKEEAVAELAEFDETIPLVENDGNGDTIVLQNEEVSKAEQEVNALIEQVILMR